MRTNEERIQALHARICALRRMRERRKTAALGAGCGVLSVCLLFMVFGGGTHPGGAAGLYSGATMLFEGAGPYVLIALAAFMAGVIVSAALIRNRKQETGRNYESRESTETKEEDDLHRERQLPEGGDHDA